MFQFEARSYPVQFFAYFSVFLISPLKQPIVFIFFATPSASRIDDNIAVLLMQRIVARRSLYKSEYF